jgi:hypothetical protein
MQIRTGMRSTGLIAAAVSLTGLLALFPLGCGGGGGTVQATPTPVPGGGGGATPTPGPVQTAGFKVKIEWGARSRVVGLSSALSARITMAGANPAGGDISWVVNRPDGIGESAVSYDSPVRAKVGTYLLTVKFYTQPLASGDEAGFAQASASVLADGSVTVTISTYTGMSSVELIAGQSISVGETKDLAFSAKNAAGNVVAVTRGSAFFTVVADATNLGVVSNGSAVKGLRPTQATVTVRVDSATSAATVVKVNSPTSVVVSTPGTTTIGSEYPISLTASVGGLPGGLLTGDDEVLWTIDGGESDTNGQLTNKLGKTVTYVAPKVTGDTVRVINVIATSKYDSTKRYVIPITVNAPAKVEISSGTLTPVETTISLEQALSLSAIVKNLSSRIPAGDIRRTVTWEVVRDGANPVGVVRVNADDPNTATYVAPKREGLYTVRAISVYDGTKVAEAKITVSSKVGVKITPNPVAQLNWEDSVNLSAEVLETPNQTVTWSVISPAGFSSAVQSTGANLARFTAPKRNATYVVRAISSFDPRKFFDVPITVSTTIGVTITAPLIISPADAVLVSINRTKDFAGTLSGLPTGRDNTMSYQIVGPADEANIGNKYGTLTVTGPTSVRYTAPAVVPGVKSAADYGRLKVIGISNYDTAAKKTVPVKVVEGSIGVTIE